MNPQRYTESQVLFGLREVFRDLSGVEQQFAADTRIDLYMKAEGIWDDLDFTDIFRELEGFFGFDCSDEEWTNFFGVQVAKRSLKEWENTLAPNLTFGSLARFIVNRAVAVASFDAIMIFGRPCLPAGVFEGIQRVVYKSMSIQPRFAPSTRIIDVLKGSELDRFWSQLRWMTEHAIPELPSFWRNVTGTTGVLSVLSVVASLIATWETSNPFWVLLSLFIATTIYLLGLIYKRLANPLPSHLVTFRDLSLLISSQRS